ncbi:hypothetical protein [Brevundimonas sp.]|uniref:hypothetical protein n=1 Tax=Brevundimonas sp. TaxID=1871086 RepID=UPI003A8DF519
MFIAIARPAVEPVGPDPVAVPGSPTVAPLTPRALHARLLDNAAARRMRARERRLAHRDEDARYWLAATLTAVRKAGELRSEDRSFASLP